MDATVPNLQIDESALRVFCEKWDIAELAVFGSVLRDDFGPESDVDFLVTFTGSSPSYVDWWDMREELARPVGRPVDLAQRKVVEEDANWLRRRQILDSARAIYGDAA
jgi:predicted nucleotidyltransferase